MIELNLINRVFIISGLLVILTSVSLTHSLTKLYFEKIIREQEKENFLLRIKILELLEKNDVSEQED